MATSPMYDHQSNVSSRRVENMDPAPLCTPPRPDGHKASQGPPLRTCIQRRHTHDSDLIVAESIQRRDADDDEFMVIKADSLSFLIVAESIQRRDAEDDEFLVISADSSTFPQELGPSGIQPRQRLYAEDDEFFVFKSITSL